MTWHHIIYRLADRKYPKFDNLTSVVYIKRCVRAHGQKNRNLYKIIDVDYQ